MSAVVIEDRYLPTATSFLATLRSELGRSPGDVLHWRNFRSHSPRLHASASLGNQQWATIASVVVCKRHLAGQLTDDQAYLYTFRLLLERLSWLARDSGCELRYTLAHIVRFKLATLRSYEAVLRILPDCQIAWEAVDPRGGKIDQPSRVEYLQLADIAASATFLAFEPDVYGNTEQRYLENLNARLYRRPPGRLTSYGLKMHPWNSITSAAYPWVATL